VIDATTVKALLKEINATYFNSELDLTYVFVSFPKMRGKLANFIARNKEWQALQINPVFQELPIEEVFDTLVHEMVHIWQYQNGLPLDHRANFKRKAAEIGTIDPGLDITRTGGSKLVLDLLGYELEGEE
jgi:predicted SprT family Zn-dependent metalloprotease